MQYIQENVDTNVPANKCLMSLNKAIFTTFHSVGNFILFGSDGRGFDWEVVGLDMHSYTN